MGLDKNFFYDKQLSSNNITWELRAQPWTERGETVNSDSDYTVPILKGIIQETEFSVSGNHNFSSPGGLLGQAYQGINSLVDMINTGSSNVAHTSGVLREAFDAVRGDGAWGDTMKYLDSKLGDHSSYNFIKDTANLMTSGSQLITGFDQIQVFKGTNLAVDLPPLSTRIYHDVPIVGITESEYATTVIDSLGELMNRFIGPYIDGNEKIGSMIGIQCPPNDFKPDFTGIGSKRIQGTFQLRYGPHKINNLLVSSFQYRLSTFSVREGGAKKSGEGYVKSAINTNRGSSGSNNKPLYVDVIVSIQPATIMSRRMLLEVLNMSQWNVNK